ncbi:hypothetical protein D6D25_00446 [Aureobasidium pullulans]|nr:hypothetical protein D6D25_00446 [Aureobasidium pullulans]
MASSPIGRHVPLRPHGRPNECPVDTYVDARAIHNCIRRIQRHLDARLGALQTKKLHASFRSESPASRLVVGASPVSLVLHAVESPESGYDKKHRFGPHIYI